MVLEWFSNVRPGVVFTFGFVVPLVYFVELLSDVVVEALAGNIRAEVLTDVNLSVLAAMITAFEFPMPIPLEESRC